MNFEKEKIINLEKRMASEKGPFYLFALFLREDAPDKWDLVVAADWIDQDKEGALKFIASSLLKELAKGDLFKLSRIVLIEEDNPALTSMQRAVNVEHGWAEIDNSNFFGLQIKQAYLVTSRRRSDAPSHTTTSGT